MNALEAAHKVLSEAGQPLHFREITRRMLAAGYWQTSGSTPWATVNAQISVAIQTGDSAFVRTTPGTYALAEWAQPSKPVPGGSTTAATTVEQVPEKMTFTNAAEAVLKRFAQRRPMHYAEITRLALEHSLIQTTGQTPQATGIAQQVRAGISTPHSVPGK